MEPAIGPLGLTAVEGGLTFVREHPQMFRHLAYDGPLAAACLAEGALTSGAEHVQVGRAGPVHYVAADIDWLTNTGGRDPFVELVGFPEFGPNAIRPEVVVAAFAKSLATIAGRRARAVVGEMPSVDARFDQYGSGRVVLFEFGTAELADAQPARPRA
jgi:hypothetical protein